MVGGICWWKAHLEASCVWAKSVSEKATGVTWSNIDNWCFLDCKILGGQPSSPLRTGCSTIFHLVSFDSVSIGSVTAVHDLVVGVFVAKHCKELGLSLAMQPPNTKAMLKTLITRPHNVFLFMQSLPHCYSNFLTSAKLFSFSTTYAEPSCPTVCTSIWLIQCFHIAYPETSLRVPYVTHLQ